MKSGIRSVLPPDVSGALRYERVAQLEAVLRLREVRRRRSTWKIASAAVLIASAVALWMVW